MRGMPPLGRLLTNYQVGEYVDIIIDPSQQKGQPHRRFHGKVAKVTERRGNAYLVGLMDKRKPKTLIVRPEHIRKHKF